MKTIYIVTKYDNYGFNKHYEPEVRAFTSLENAHDAILLDIKDDWEESEISKVFENLKDGAYSVHNSQRHWGEYKYTLDEIKSGNF